MKLGERLRRQREASRSQHGDELRKDLDAARAAGLDVGDYWVRQRLEAKGLPWTRENFVQEKWCGELPVDEFTGQPYVPDDELPDDLR